MFKIGKLLQIYTGKSLQTYKEQSELELEDDALKLVKHGYGDFAVQMANLIQKLDKRNLVLKAIEAVRVENLTKFIQSKAFVDNSSPRMILYIASPEDIKPAVKRIDQIDNTVERQWFTSIIDLAVSILLRGYKKNVRNPQIEAAEKARHEDQLDKIQQDVFICTAIRAANNIMTERRQEALYKIFKSLLKAGQTEEALEIVDGIQVDGLSMNSLEMLVIYLTDANQIVRAIRIADQLKNNDARGRSIRYILSVLNIQGSISVAEHEQITEAIDGAQNRAEFEELSQSLRGLTLEAENW